MIVDATFRFAADRREFAAALGRAADDAVWIECRAPAAVLTRRAAERLDDPDRVSDADAPVAARQADEWEPLAVPNHVVAATNRSPAAVLAAAGAVLDRLLRRG